MPVPLKPANLSRLKNLNVKLPARDNSTGDREFQGRIRNWATGVEADAATETKVPVTAVELTRAHVDRFAKARKAGTLAELVERQGFTLESYVGVFYSGLVAQEFAKAHSSYETARRAPQNAAQTARLDRNWSRVTAGYLSALQRAGLASASVPGLQRMARELTSRPESYNEFMSAFTSGTRPVTTVAPRGAVVARVLGDSVSLPLDRAVDFEVHVPANWCGIAPIEGVYTKKWSAGFSIRKTISYPCGLSCNWDWFNSDCDIKWCSKTFVLLAGSVSFSLEIGYRVSCCGASGWGTVTAKGCGTVLNSSLCVSCTATVAAVALSGRTKRADGSCAYGLGLVVSFKCAVGGRTVLNGSKPIGWTVTGACPPAILNC